MNLEIIKKLVLSHSQEDNVLGYSYMINFTWGELQELFPYTPSCIKIYREGKKSGKMYADYDIGGIYHVHDYGTAAYLYPGPGKPLNTYIKL